MGTLWHKSGTVERYADDLRAVGAKAYFFIGGTVQSTPLTVFLDSGQTQAHPHPLLADAKGRWPDVFIPYITSYDVRTTDQDDVELTYTKNIPNPNPVDITTIAPAQSLLTTGMVHCEFINAPKAGYARLNGQSIGDATSGATQIASSDTRPLFLYLWNNVNNEFCPVFQSGLPVARGPSAEFDYDQAHKALGLPDMRGYLFCGLDTMGNSPANILPPPINWNLGTGELIGSSIGGVFAQLAAHHVPPHTHGGSTGAPPFNVSHGHTLSGESAGEDRPHTHSLGNYTTGTDQAIHHHNVPDLQVLLSPSFGAGSFQAVTSVVYGSPDGPSTTDNTAVPHSHSLDLSAQTTGNESIFHRHVFSAAVGSTVVADSITQNLSHSHTFTTGDGAPGLAGLPFMNMQPTRTITWFIKL